MGNGNWEPIVHELILLLFSSMFCFQLFVFVIFFFLNSLVVLFSVGNLTQISTIFAANIRVILFWWHSVYSSTFLSEQKHNVYIPKVSTIWYRQWNKWNNHNVKIFIFVHRSDCLTFCIFVSNSEWKKGIQFILKLHTKEWCIKCITSKH